MNIGTGSHPGSSVAPGAGLDRRQHRSVPAEGQKHTETRDGQSTPTWVVIVSALLLSIPLALCCYLLLTP
jgi:hypothetical protein